MSFPRRKLLRTLSFAFGAGFISTQREFGMMAQTAAQSAIPAPSAAAVDKSALKGTDMEKVTGIGGFFFPAKDPKALAHWYLQHLGISLAPSSYADTVWEQETGPTVFEPQAEKSDLLEDKAWVLNFRVRNLDRMAAQLRTAGIAVKMDPQSYPNGRFASLHDPEGNPIQLWQPKSRDASR